MDNNGGNTNNWGVFDGSFLAFTLLSGILAVVYLLYFNRILASIVSYFIRTYTWHRYNIYIDFKAFQISLLAGRLFFIGLRYHGNNETILIQHGHITWSYWQRRVRDSSIYDGQDRVSGANGEGKVDPDKTTKLPSLISVTVSGVEWFVYNRSAAYSSILDAMIQDSRPNTTTQNPETYSASEPKPRQQNGKSAGQSDTARGHNGPLNGEKDGLAGAKSQSPASASLSGDAKPSPSTNDDLPFMIRFFPIHFDCDKAALVMGNPNTKSVLVIKTQSLSGEIDAASCQTPDPYRQLFKLQFKNPVVQMKVNRDFKEDQLTRAVRDKQTALSSAPPPPRPFFRRHRRKVLGRLRDLVPYWRKSVESFSVGSRHAATTIPDGQIPGAHHWQGLTRYLNDDEDDDKLRWASIEYAAVETIIDSPAATLILYWDVPGRVLPATLDQAESQPDRVNGAAPPAWAINISIGGGTINYGPWADRHRAELQRVFFPGQYKDASPAEKLQVGAFRVPTVFNVYVELDDEITLRIPTREDSKNWRWRKEADALRDHLQAERQRVRRRNQKASTAAPTQQRPYGWLDVKVARNATISYSADMLAGPTGYKNSVNIDIPATEVSTSVNHGILWKSGAQRITCDLSAPLGWNTLRTWRFNIDSDALELYILRDHIFLLTDLVNDWGSGPPGEYLLFTPFRYMLNLQLRNFKLFLNVNDVNVIDNPTELEDNAFLIVESPQLIAETCIPLDQFRPPSNTIPFDISAETVSLAIHVPPWNTQATFLTCKDIGQLENLCIEAKYHYLATTSPANTDTLVLNVSGQSPMVRLYGFYIRYFLQLKDNYFGDYVHFRTLDEYQESIRLESTDPEAAAAARPPNKKSNDMDVMLNIRLDDPKILLPANMYSAKRHIPIEAASIAIDLRFTNYYMDLELSISPVSLAYDVDSEGATSPIGASTTTQLFIDGLSIYGHRVFGLPPTEPTYMCNWDLSVGAITGECSPDFLTALMQGGKAFAFSFDDDENALIPYSSLVVFDVTFLRLTVESIMIWLHVEEAAFLCSTGPVRVNFNDWARTHYSKRADIDIPSIELACVDSENATRRRSQLQPLAKTHAFLRTDIQFALVGRKHDFAKARQLQQELIRRHDQRTQRTEFLLLPNVLDALPPDLVDPVAQSVPSVPQPVFDDDVELEAVSSRSPDSSWQPGNLRKKASFLSFSSGSSRPSPRARTGITRGRNRNTPPMQSGPAQNRPSMPARDFSASTGRHSAFYSAHAEILSRQDPQHSTVAFASQYFAPYFPFDNVLPDYKEAILPGLQNEPEQEPEISHGFDDVAQFTLEDIDPAALPQDVPHQSLIIELPKGVTAFGNAQSLRHVATLLATMQPRDPEDILDTLHLNAISGVLDWKKEQELSGKITDINVRLPRASIRFLNDCEIDCDDSGDRQDQYDLSLNSISLAIRSRSQLGTSRERELESKSSLHFRLGSAEFSAAERLAVLNQTQAAVIANIDKVLVSLGSKDVTYMDADIGAVRTTSTSGKVEYLASLIHRTNCLGTEMSRLFATTSARVENRVHHLVRTLAAEMHNAGDPTFLVRPSTILRVADDHLRTYDSWKMMMRLRQLWTVMDDRSREHLVMDCLNGTPKTSPDTRQSVIAAFETWRHWDLANLQRTILLAQIFGESSRQKHGKALPLMAVARLQQAQLVLDPGPKQNHAFLVDLTVRMEDKAHDDSSRPLETPVTAVNVYCGHAGVNLNWELCELLEDVLKLFGNSSLDTESPDFEVPLERPTSKSPQPSRIFHVVIGMALGSLVFETINLTAEGKTESLGLSVVANASGSAIRGTNAILECNAATCRLWSHGQSIATCRLKRPNIFVDYTKQPPKDDVVDVITAVAHSEDLNLVVKQDPLALAEIVDMLIRDEVAQLYQLRKHVPVRQSKKTTPSRPPKAMSHIRLDLTMFMNAYTITLPLLRSIIYTVSGAVTRAKLAANLGKEMVFDFDIAENKHRMQVKINNRPTEISLLAIPPTNGRVISHQTADEHSLIVFASVEEMTLDASNVYSFLSALNRPEISTTLTELQEQGKIIDAHISEIFGKPNPAPPKPDIDEKPTPKLVYGIHGTLAGLRIHGETPLEASNDMSAKLSFCLSSVQLHLANKSDKGNILANPEFHVNLRRIALDIEKGPRDDLRNCGNLSFGALLTATTREADDGTDLRSFDFKSDGFELNFSSDTVSTVIDVVGYMGNKIKDLDTSRELEYLRKLRQSRPKITINDDEEETSETDTDIFDTFLSSIIYSFEVRDIKLCWLVGNTDHQSPSGEEDLVLSFKRVEFGTRQKKMARLLIENLQLQLVPPGHDKTLRSTNSALMPEAIFNIAYVSTDSTRRLAFQAVGKPIDLRLTSAFIIPVKQLQDSISLSMKNVQHASETWAPIIPPQDKSSEATTPVTAEPRRTILGRKRLESLLIDADFAGAVVHLSAKRPVNTHGTHMGHSKRMSVAGKYGQFTGGDGSSSSTVLRTPGLALKAEYRDSGTGEPAVYGELKVDGSSNTLYPSVVPLILDITSSIKDVVGDDTPPTTPSSISSARRTSSEAGKSDSEKGIDENNILTADASAVLGGVKLNLGLRICQQVFTLSSQPIGRVAATMSFGDIYLTVNTVHSPENGNFFAISGVFSQFKTVVQHVYSRESTASFEVDSIVVSLMNSKHVSGTSGISAIVKVSPMEMAVNARQLQDFLLFREIWLPRDVRSTPAVPLAKESTDMSQVHLMQRYQEVAATAAFPWTASLSITALNVKVDLGQSLGKSEFSINDFWISSKKTSDWEQNLCLGFGEISVDFKGRLSGFVTLQTFKLRTSIEWPERKQALNKTPRIQASIGFRQFRLKGAFDYQAFLVADITSMEFLMYNVRQGRGDRLVAIVDAGAVQTFGVTSSAAQVVALWQAIQKLIAERKASFESSLKDIEKFIQRRSVSSTGAVPPTPKKASENDAVAKSPISLDTDVIIVLKALNLGVFPSTFSDRQVFKLEASNAQLRFAASMENERIHSVLGLTLGQLRIGLAGVRNSSATAKPVNELSVEEVVQSATGSRGGTILKVPRVEAVMQTFQKPDSRTIEYIFKSSFEGKVEVGWNYSRIVSIRGMWANHSRLLAQTWGREIPALSAIKVTGVPEPVRDGGQDGDDNNNNNNNNNNNSNQEQQQKITAEVNVPQSKFEYVALEPPIIETPQLRDMGEATPPLEWIGINRDKLPNLTHQIVILSLLELAGEVEDAYSKILGSS